LKTNVSISGMDFTINGKLTYSEVPESHPNAHGLLMNARFIQGVFDDKEDPDRFARFGWTSWDADRHTDELMQSLPMWYSYGLRGFTVGFQGGMPVFTVENSTINNNPFTDDGKVIEKAYLERMDRLIRAADALGMVVIVSILYQGQAPRMHSGAVIRNAVRAACRWLRDSAFTNVIIEVANEYNIGAFKDHRLVSDPEGISTLVEIAREESGGMLVGASGGGAECSREVAEASDVILIHGNMTRRQDYYRVINAVQSWGLSRPIVCNEDSPCFTQLDVAFHTHTSWGYYNNLTKQEPPAAWGIANAEDLFFARRMARGVGIPIQPLDEDKQYVLDGLQGRWEWRGQRWVRLTAEFPERINLVEFFLNGNLIDVAYQEPFYVNYEQTWIQKGILTRPGDQWRAEIHLADGRVLVRNATVEA
jgi:hypothetical protein